MEGLPNPGAHPDAGAATDEEAIRALAKHQSDLLLEVKTLYYDFPAYVASLNTDDLESLKMAILLEEDHREEAVKEDEESERRSILESESEKEKRCELSGNHGEHI